jgi:hypothetical protein
MSQFEQLTTRPNALPQENIPASPMGAYMSFNDASLPRGGKFDTNGGWLASLSNHEYHREGHGIDVNFTAGVIDIATGQYVRGGRQNSLRNDIRDACLLSGCPEASLVDEGPVHCEMGPTP